MRTNKPSRWTETTHEGAPAARINAAAQLRRSLMSCLLWENEFYEDGQTIAERIRALVPLVDPAQCADMAVEARERMKLRHAPLWVAVAMAATPTHKHLVAPLIARIVQRPDELTELLSLYALGRKGPKKLNKLSMQVRKGLAQALAKFNEYSLAKFDQAGEVKLRDVIRLVHPKPKDAEQAALWKRAMTGDLATPDTWEVAISGAQQGERQAQWIRLLSENKLGALALLRNLRNLTKDGVPSALIREAILKMRTERVLPFRFVAAAKYAPHLEPELEQTMFRCGEGMEKLPGLTVLLVDVSGSMDHANISARSEMTRMDAACALAMLLRERCESVRVLTFSGSTVEVPPRRGFALRDAVVRSQPHGSTMTGPAIAHANKLGYSRLIVVTDEQSHTSITVPTAKGYFINVASSKNGIGYGPWVHLDGWSEAIVEYIIEAERTDGAQ